MIRDQAFLFSSLLLLLAGAASNGLACDGPEADPKRQITVPYYSEKLQTFAIEMAAYYVRFEGSEPEELKGYRSSRNAILFLDSRFLPTLLATLDHEIKEPSLTLVEKKPELKWLGPEKNIALESAVSGANKAMAPEVIRRAKDAPPGQKHPMLLDQAAFRSLGFVPMPDFEKGSFTRELKGHQLLVYEKVGGKKQTVVSVPADWPKESYENDEDPRPDPEGFVVDQPKDKGAFKIEEEAGLLMGQETHDSLWIETTQFIRAFEVPGRNLRILQFRRRYIDAWEGAMCQTKRNAHFYRLVESHSK